MPSYSYVSLMAIGKIYTDETNLPHGIEDKSKICNQLAI